MDAKKSTPEDIWQEPTVHYETQTEANSRQRDCANADGQETVRRLFVTATTSAPSGSEHRNILFQCHKTSS
jgi:hypothetical protein